MSYEAFSIQEKEMLAVKCWMATSYTKLNDIRKLTEQLYLAFGNSPSSFLHLTVGTGSPLASHLNSALSSTVTAKLLGLFTKDGLSKGKKK